MRRIRWRRRATSRSIRVEQGWSAPPFRGAKIAVMPAKAGAHLSAAPLTDAGSPHSSV